MGRRRASDGNPAALRIVARSSVSVGASSALVEAGRDLVDRIYKNVGAAFDQLLRDAVDPDVQASVRSANCRYLIDKAMGIYERTADQADLLNEVLQTMGLDEALEQDEHDGSNARIRVLDGIGATRGDAPDHGGGAEQDPSGRDSQVP